MMRCPGNRRLLPLLLPCFLPLTMLAEHVQLKPVADTFIAEAFPDKNFGGMLFLNCGTTQTFTTNRGLMKFDIAGSIPAGAKIVSVALTNEVVGQPDEPWNSANCGLHRLLRDWGEGDNVASKPSQAAAAGTNEACWTHRFAFTTNTWGQPGGQPGVDYVEAPSVTEFIYDAGLFYVFGPTTQMVADVQRWLDASSENFGWMLIEQSETTDWTARRYGSREDPFDYAKLGIEFLPPPRFSRVQFDDGQVHLSFTAEVGASYVVEAVESISATNVWSPVTLLGPVSSRLEFTIAEPISSPQRFYRVRFH